MGWFMGRMSRAVSVALAGLGTIGLAIGGQLPGSAGAATTARTASAHANKNSTITISAADGETWPCSFNPFNPNTYFFSLGMVNEELYYINSLTGKMTPWLATAYHWADDAKVLTWTIRKGVKFNDGEPLTPEDVAYTFELIKKNPSLDLQAIDPMLRSVAVTGPDQVTMTFKKPAATLFYYIADQISIVPKSIWEKVKNPLTWPDTHPVGTGAYVVSACSPQNMTYSANPDFWMPGLPKIKTVEVPAIIANSTANEMLENGQAQWGGQFIPYEKKAYLDRSPSYRDWSPVAGYHGIYINLTDPILSKLAVRQAIAYGINRPQVANLAEDGQDPPANQSGVLLPDEKAWYNSAVASRYDDYAYNPSKAVSVLEKAGYKRGPGGIFQTRSGLPLSFTMITVGGYSDWVAACQVIANDLRQIGIEVKESSLSTPTYTTDTTLGKFQLAYGGPPGITIDGPFGMLRGILYSGNTAPINKAAASNFERFSSASEDKLFGELNSATSQAEAQAIIKQIEVPMLTEVPFIPIADSTALNQYNASVATGWPTAANPYANGSPTTQPDEEVVLLHLVPKG